VADQTVCLVADGFGANGTAYRETETIIGGLMGAHRTQQIVQGAGSDRIVPEMSRRNNASSA